MLCWGNSVLLAKTAPAATIRVAVASNFYPVAQKLVVEFERSTSYRVLLSAGSTGKHYAQIANGAPFDVFLAADQQRPEKLVAQGIGVPASRATFAIGRLALWSPASKTTEEAISSLNADFRRLAIANPKLAPYGRAAKQVLVKLGLNSAVESRTVRGDNISQAFQFVASGNAELGFVAVSQLLAAPVTVGQGIWLVPEAYYSPLVQQALLIKDSLAGQHFLRFLMSAAAQTIIRESGYQSPR